MEKPSATGVALSAGSIIAGKYRLLSPVAEGGMGVVWRAEDLQLAAPVAVKLLHARNLHDPETRARFEAEAAIGAQLRSPHVVQIFEMGVDSATDLPFIAMELLEGESLQERLARSGPLAPRELLLIVSQVAQALTRAHALGVIHRDLKPANIFLVREGDTLLAKVLDFGIAKRFGASSPARTLTGDLLGTPTYMSPEQIMGSRAVDQRSDLWSLGVIAAECLTGRLPFEADNLAGLALAICQGRYLLPSSLGPVPPGFDAWFRKATATGAEARFDSAAQLVEALRTICGREAADGAAPFFSARAPLDAAHTLPLPSASGLTPDRTVQLPGPQRPPARRAQRMLLGAAVGGGALLILAALRIRLPGATAPSLTPSASSAVFPNTPLPNTPALRATPPLSDAPPLSSPPSLPSPSRSSPAALASGAGGAPTQPPPVANGQQRPAAPRRVERSTSAAPAPRPRPPPDPDNLGF